jgi:putative membrane protein
MYWWPDGGWAWAAWPMMIGMLAFWGAIAWVVVTLVRRAPGPKADRMDAEEILAERFARGEIDEEEYRRRRDFLRVPR